MKSYKKYQINQKMKKLFKMKTKFQKYQIKTTSNLDSNLILKKKYKNIAPQNQVNHHFSHS